MTYLTTMSDLPEFTTETLTVGLFYVPRPLMDHYFKEFKANGVMAYALLLNRLNEPLDSFKKGQDDDGNTFVRFTNEDLAEALNCSLPTVISTKQFLAQKGLIVEERQGVGKSNRIYLTDEILSYYQ